MARKSKEEMEQTRLALLEAALNLFAEKGYSRTTLNDIAQRAGFTRGAVYWHFKDKPMIFSEVMGHYEAPLVGLVVKETSKAENPVQWLEALYKGHIKVLGENSDLQTAMFVRVRRTEFPDELLPYYSEKQRERELFHQEIKKQIAEGIRHGYFRKDLNVDVAAGTAMAFLMGIVSTLLTGSGTELIKDLDGSIEIFLRGFKA